MLLHAMWGFQLFHVPARAWALSHLRCSPSGGCEQHLPVVLMCISLKANDDELLSRWRAGLIILL